MKRTWAAASIALAVALLSLPCQRRSGIEGLSLTVTFSRRNLTDDLYVDMTSKWRVSKDFQGFSGDRHLLASFHHGEDLLSENEFAPDVPTSKWEPGREYVFVRRLYIPHFIDEYNPGFHGSEPLVLTVGFSGSGLEGEDSGAVILRRRLRISPAPLTPAVLYMDGWHEPEEISGLGSRQGRWTGRAARCLIDNPGRNALLVIRGESDVAAVPGQEITISVGGTVLEKFVPEKRGFERSYPISRNALGDEKDFFLEISVDRTFKPAGPVSESGGTGERGVFISFIYFR